MHKNLKIILLAAAIDAGIFLNNAAQAEPDQIQYPLPTVKVTIDPALTFEFCIVPLGIGDAPFATRKFMIGGGMEGYKAPRTECLIAGSVVMSVGKKPDWCLLVGKYEVTVAQWNGVLGLPAPAESDAKMPITKVSRAEVTSFIEKANEKMRRLKSSKPVESPFEASFAHSFLRLPTEAEWEFAARGGNAVDSTVFGKFTPYDGELNRYEWFFSQNSSKGKLKGVGLLKPNPLGIHDMLGNAAEMADGHYQVEYSQGRFGGLVIRGGDYGFEEKDVISSMRTEVPWIYEDDGSAYKSSKTGFRLVMGSMLGANQAEIAALNTAWGTYSENRIQPATSMPATAPIAVKARDDVMNINSITKSLASKIDQGEGQALSTKNDMKDRDILMTSLLAKVNDAEVRSSKVAVRLMSFISQEAVTNGAKKIQAETDANLSSSVKQSKIQTCEIKLSEAGRVIEEACEMLADIGPDSVKVAFKAHLKLIDERIGNTQDPDIKAALKRQVAVTEVAREVVLNYVRSRRIDLDAWKNGVMKISRKMLEETK